MRPDPHRLAELRSLAMHRVIAARIPDDPSILVRARAKAEVVARAKSRSSHAAHEWLEILAGDALSIRELMTESSERANRLRQSTPFAGTLEPRERWRIWREVSEASRG